MKCEVCGIGEREPRRIRYTQTEGPRLAIVENVPAEVCNHCGEVTLSRTTVDVLQETICGNGRPVKTIEVPVYAFAGGDS